MGWLFGLIAEAFKPYFEKAGEWLGDKLPFPIALLVISVASIVAGVFGKMPIQSKSALFVFGFLTLIYNGRLRIHLDPGAESA